MPREIVRLIMPDSHGNHIDPKAKAAFLHDVKLLEPDEIVALGDHVDCGGTFSTHQRTYTHEMTESYEDDCAAANDLFDGIQTRAPKAAIHYLEGNHEQHVERWAARSFQSHKDAKALLEKFAPAAMLRLKSRGIRYYKRSEQYMGIPNPGIIRLGKCYFVHGISHSKHAASAHLARIGANVCFGHVHRMMSVTERTVTSSGFGAWSCGTLAKLQPLYRHTEPTSWVHGYAVQFVARSGLFVHFNIPIVKGESLLKLVLSGLQRAA